MNCRARRAHSGAVRACGRLIPAVLAIVVLGACSRSGGPPPEAPVPVTVVTAQVRDVPVRIDATGTVEAINSVAVKSLVDGTLERAFVADGARVDAGQPLFRIDPRPAEAELHQAEAQRAKDGALLDQARSQVRRYAAVAAKGYISADQMQQYRTNLEAAGAAVKVDEANVAAARLSLGYTDIRAPIAGRLGRILIQPGNVVKANDTNPLVVINQIEPIYVTFPLPGRDLARLQQAQSAQPLAVAARAEGAATAVPGKVAFIDNAVDSTTGTIRLRAEFANAGHALWPGQLVSVSVTIGHDPQAIVVPNRAVQDGPDGRYVFVVGANGHVEQRVVTVDRVEDGNAVVAKGLAAGETVVLDGQSRLQDGTTVKVTAEPS
ncbi:MAG: efflux RND transporter periplasmic adaptor subunit [Lysobacterales bacterium]